ncbi:MAG: hypothetical protein ACOC4I_06825 [Spirochaetota bacterium]
MEQLHHLLVRGAVSAILVLSLTAFSPFDDVPRASVFDPEELSSDWELLDTNDDGQIDYAVVVDDDGLLVRASMDYSGDGLFDNFYAYDEGRLVMHEIDSNSNGRVDLRVFVTEGDQVVGFEQDTNHDGTMDRIEVYDEEDSEP